MLVKLENKLKHLGKIAVAYSGGIDSSYLLYIANKVLPKENVMAVIANGNMLSRIDYYDAITFLKENEFNYTEIQYNPLDIIELKENHEDRCYHCKKKLLNIIKEVSKENGFYIIADGKNLDDLNVYRPGNKASEEIGVLSPLSETGFTKRQIREYARDVGIKFWDKPSNSCLVTRFPYNTKITNEDLKKVELSEEIIKSLGIKDVRVRVHNDIARIEVKQQDFDVLLKNKYIIKEIRKLGFRFVTLDLDGIRSGSFDIKINEKK